jgi:hypothetical protein
MLAAVVGLGVWAFMAGYVLAAANYPQEERYQAYRYVPGNPDASNAALLDKSKSTEYRKPCEQPEGRDDSDLCAQWKAARAGETSALWAKASFWLGLAGTLGLIVTLWFNYRLLRFTQDSGKDTEVALAIAGRNADAARDQVDVARAAETAYLVAKVATPQIEKWLIDGNLLGWAFQVINAGRTPAFSVEIQSEIYIPRFNDLDLFLKNPPLRVFGIKHIPDIQRFSTSRYESIVLPEGGIGPFIDTSGPPLVNFEQAPDRRKLHTGVQTRAGIVWLKIKLGYTDAWGRSHNIENLFTIEPEVNATKKTWSVFEVTAEQGLNHS